jgi:nitrate reductase gamma subunit
MLATITNFGDAVHYRESVAPYFRGFLVFDPDPGLMTGEGVTLIFQLHVTIVWFLYALWPFSRLVHAWSLPVDYLRRSPILYRSRLPRARPSKRQPEVVTGMEASRR